ncbi:tyrosine-type recombinase/integrase [Thalassotalea sp. G20_0]|uniref:tyrosine-type recombinase/integrase n=1 Tax=Thalassotalea sp. G20_0 TaxID=2821093 RepID=UPI001AD9EFF3|nr:tyrosine-type recombinase/integrase [Thalassotalea sp. G20_0]MBO9497125.1 tyrosine-type recombinase/integrase [Thalassotalea sp. G20_0]
MSNKKVMRFSKSKLMALKPAKQDYFVRDELGAGLRIKVSKSGTKTFQVQKRHAGKVKTITLGKFVDANGSMQIHPEQAQRRAREIYSEITLGIKQEADSQEGLITLREFFKIYPSYIQGQLKTVDATLARIKKNFAYLFDSPLKDITPKVIQRWRRQKIAEGLSNGTINRSVSSLRGLLSRAVDDEILEIHPLHRLKPLSENKMKRKRFLNDQPEVEGELSELDRFIRAMVVREDALREKRRKYNVWRKERDYDLLPELDEFFVDYVRPLLMLALYTGMRRGELFRLMWFNIDLNRKLIHLPESITKTSKGRTIALSDNALALLLQWRKQSGSQGLVFPSPKTGKQLDNIDNAWKTVLRHAGLNVGKGDPRHFRFHDMRHTFASLLVSKGVSLARVQQYLGHTTIEMTMVYAHLAPEKGEAEVNKLDFLY